MRKILALTILALLCTVPVHAQQGNTTTIRFAGAPTGACAPLSFGINSATGALYDCVAGTWTLVGTPGGGASPGGATGTVQYNAAGSFGGITGLTGNEADCDGFMTSCQLLSTIPAGTFGLPYLFVRRVTGGPANNYLTFTGEEVDTNTHILASMNTYDGTNGSFWELHSLTGFRAGPSITTFNYRYPTASSCTPPAATICVSAASAGTTAYQIELPKVAAQGTWFARLESGPKLTQSFSGDAQHSAVVTTGSGTSIGSTELCGSSFCIPGTYRVNVYTDITTACGVSGTYLINLIYTDDQGAKTVPVNISGTGTVPATGVLTTTSANNFGQTAQILRLTSGAINYSTTAVACGAAGPMVGKLYLSAEPVQ